VPIVVSTSEIDELGRRFLAASKDIPRDFARLREDIRRAALVEAKRAITKVYNVAPARVDKDLKAKETNLGVLLVGQKKTISAVSYKFKATARKGVARGVRGRFTIKGPVYADKHAFFAQGLRGNTGDLAEGNTQVFWRGGPKRKMTAGRYKGKVREPLHALHGPSVADHLKDTRVSVPLRVAIFDRIKRRYNQISARRLKRNR